MDLEYHPWRYLRGRWRYWHVMYLFRRLRRRASVWTDSERTEIGLSNPTVAERGGAGCQEYAKAILDDWEMNHGS